MLLQRQLLARLFIFIGILDISIAIDCYQCSSTNNKNPFQCNEILGTDHDLNPEACDAVYGAKYCVKHTGRFEGGIGTKRFCSSLDLGNYCDYINQPGDILTYRTCIHTCSGSGCNASSQNVPVVFSTVFSTIILLTMKMFCR